MKKAAEDFPDDLDIATLYVESIMNLMPWKLWDQEGKAAKDTPEVVSILEAILRRDPDHIGACHYQIHALEASPFPERALASADRLLRNIPWQGHLTHMAAHIYIHTGDFRGAALANDLAIMADEAYFKARPGKGVYSLMYYPHNIHFLAYAHACGGKYKDALEAAKKLADYVEPEIEHMPMMEGFAVFPLMIDLRFHQWDSILAAPVLGPDSKRVATRLFQHYAHATAHAAKGQWDLAENQRQAFLALAAKVPAETPMGTNTAGQILAVAGKTLEARLAKEPERAIKAWGEVIALEDKLNYGEPPDWIFRGREHLGAALLRAGKAKEAEAAFREDLRRLRRSGRALFGLMHSLRAQKRDEEADLVRREFERAWPAETRLRLEDF
jgi:tetratricopeptide (TPR) repeat protein